MTEFPSVPRPRPRRLGRGYEPNLPALVVKELRDLEATCVICSVTWAISYHLTIVLVSVIAFFMWQQAWLLGTAGYLLSLVIIARQQRGLELMVHDASHVAWHRRNQKVNDRLADLLVSYPTMSSVSGYRKSHAPHHALYGGDGDPCRRRFAAMGVGEIDLSSRVAIMVAVLRWLPHYNLAYYREIGSGSSMRVALWIVWHAVVYVLPIGLFCGAATAVVVWSLFWLVPQLTVLPVLRSIAEAEEHDYAREHPEGCVPTEFNTTFTNIGTVHSLLIHPWNDGFHLVHHRYQRIPQRVHHKVHRLLLQHDPSYRRGLFRTTVLQQL